MLDTHDGGEDDADDQWQCEGYETGLKKTIQKIDYNFSKSGYKTLGVAVKKNNGPWQYVGMPNICFTYMYYIGAYIIYNHNLYVIPL